MSSACGIAELAHQVDVFARVHERELVDRGGSRWHEVAVLDQARRFDEVHRQLHPDWLQRMLVRKVMLHERVAIDERDRSGHCNLR